MQVVILVIAAALGFAGYREAEKFERKNGKGPWGGSAILWGIVCFLLGLIGLLMLYIAEKNTKKQVQANALWTQSQYGAQTGYGPSAYGTSVAPPGGQWAPPAAPSLPDGPPRPNIGGTDIIPGPH
ncbi:MAG: hypothetical protein QOF59_1429 [Actinomycetota bacterium]|jgi:hypothetical protein|nr:hypothetical protein [Actinomycetota bacterium]MDQ1478197.1 hypothetical protein [Actinomycetota bacterium]